MTNTNQNYYLPIKLRQIDRQYKNLLKHVINNGHKKSTIQGEPAITVLGAPPMRFQINNGIPLFTERNLAVKPAGKPMLWQQSIAEIIGYINGAHTIEQLESYGCYWWDKWDREGNRKIFGLKKGDLGLGFYGEAFTRFPKIDGGTFNQIAEIIEQIKTNPITRTHFISPWIPQYLIGKHRNAATTPCTGWMYFEIYDGMISLCMTQRAGDIPIGIPFNTFQYSALLLMVAQVTDLIPNEFVHMIMDAHIYENQLPAVQTILCRESRKFPILKINPEVTNLFEFRMKDFTLEEYNPHPTINIPVSI